MHNFHFINEKRVLQVLAQVLAERVLLKLDASNEGQITEAIAEKFITENEYWELETVSEIKHEYFNGRIYAMTGAKPAHNKIAFNFTGALSSRLRGHSCSGAGSDQAVKVAANGLITYPDLLIVCPPENYDRNALLNPRVIIEVLSPSTEKYDRTDKFEFVKQIAVLTDYILVAQDRVRVEHYQRNGENWTVRSYYQRDDMLVLADLELEIPLDEIYDRLDLPVGLQVLPRVENCSLAVKTLSNAPCKYLRKYLQGAFSCLFR